MVAKASELAVWKFEVPVADEIEIPMPRGARPLYVNVQRGIRCLWALVDVAAPKEARRFRFAGTGHPIRQSPEQLKHVGSWLEDEGALVFHLFEIVG